MDSAREEIVRYIVELLTNNVKDLTTVTRVVRPLDAISTAELPMAVVIDGDETRDYQGARMIAHFQVHIRLIDDRSQFNKTSTFLNNLIYKVESLLENDPYLGGKSAFPVEILRIETDEGWLYPFTFANIVVLTHYTGVKPR